MSIVFKRDLKIVIFFNISVMLYYQGCHSSFVSFGGLLKKMKEIFEGDEGESGGDLFKSEGYFLF